MPMVYIVSYIMGRAANHSMPKNKECATEVNARSILLLELIRAIITQEQFDLIQAERKARTNVETTESGKKRKSTRYSAK